MELSDIQPVVIYINEARKEHMKVQNNHMSQEFMYFKGFTPDDLKDYITQKHEKYPEKDTVFCCNRSHIAALNFFLENSDKNLALILEDDVILDNNFIEKLTEALTLWKKHELEIDYLSIGYLPSSDYRSKNVDENLHWGLYCQGGCIWGTQAYIIKRSVAEEIVSYLHKSNTTEVYSFLKLKIKENGGKIYTPKDVCLQSDVIFSVCWKQGYISPMLVIENPLFFSTITTKDSNSNTRGWNKAFKSGELNVQDFENAHLYL